MTLYLTGRDLAILQTVATARYLTTPQIQALFFQESRGGELGRLKSCQRRLHQLTRQELLRRIELPLRMGEGRQPYVYALDKVGAQILMAQTDMVLRETDWKKKPAEEHYPFLSHLLLTNDVRIAFTLACQEGPVTLAEWVDEKELRSDATDKVGIATSQGTTEQVSIIPDAYIVLSIAERKAHCFLELDRATVTVSPGKPESRGWSKKVRAYVAYYTQRTVTQDGERITAYQKRYGAKSLRILTVTTSETRLEHLLEATEQASDDTRLFWFTTFAKLTPQAVLTEKIWQVAGRDGCYSLV